MKEIRTQMLTLFRSLTRLRKAWHDSRPAEEISNSYFATLMAIAHAGDTNFPEYTPVVLVNGAITMKDLATLTHTTLPGISQKVKALEESGYVERVTDTADRRVWRIRLTANGQKVVEKAHKKMEQKMVRTIADFGEENIATLVFMLEKLSSSIEKQNEEFSTHKEKNLC